MNTVIHTPSALLPVLVATKETQGQRKNDFCWCDEDEPVRFALECDGEKVDGTCGCRRSMTGMETLKATTTIRVKQLPITRVDYLNMLAESFAKSGFPVDKANIMEEGVQLIRLAAAFRPTDIIEKRGNKLQTRKATSR